MVEELRWSRGQGQTRGRCVMRSILVPLKTRRVEEYDVKGKLSERNNIFAASLISRGMTPSAAWSDKGITPGSACYGRNGIQDGALAVSNRQEGLSEDCRQLAIHHWTVVQYREIHREYSLY
ncbi:hypothetical protein TNCV_2915891 [Trichonephila clavipes]|nr:hypothetical protein TNCV_2915891 [Trichonephila clavipes]